MNVAITRRIRFALPPVPIEAPVRRMLAGLAVIFFATGYCGTVTTNLITFVTDEFRATNAEQGRALAIIRADALIAFTMVWIADRIGRRRTLLTCAAIGLIGTACCSLAPNLAGFTALQVVARGFVTATAVIAGVLAVEETPAAARAWAASMLVACAGIGSGTTLLLLPLADLGERMWRVIYVVPLLLLMTLPVAARLLPESARFTAAASQRIAGHREPITKSVVSRFAALALWSALMTLFVSPARQFQNDFLRDERGFTGFGLTLFGLVTNIPSIIGIIAGGRLADRVGRRPVIGFGLLAFAATCATMFLTSGPAMWAAATLMSFCGAILLPAVGIYGPELFPTAFRGRASGLLTGSGRIGSAIGLATAGVLSDSRSLGGVLAVMASALIVSALILLIFLPETAQRELEELSGSDPMPTSALSAMS
jgi:MFS family permease